MAGFKGQAEYSVDSRGRVAIPSKMRKALNPEAKDTFTITRGFETCINLYPQDRWMEIEQQVAGLNQYQRKPRAFMRKFMMMADEVELDGQGRIVVPSHLLKYGEIDGRAKILGSLDHIEIWNPRVLEAHLNEEPMEDYEMLAEEVMG